MWDWVEDHLICRPTCFHLFHGCTTCTALQHHLAAWGCSHFGPLPCFGESMSAHGPADVSKWSCWRPQDHTRTGHLDVCGGCHSLQLPCKLSLQWHRASTAWQAPACLSTVDNSLCCCPSSLPLFAVQHAPSRSHVMSRKPLTPYCPGLLFMQDAPSTLLTLPGRIITVKCAGGI